MSLNPSALTVRDTLQLIDGDPAHAWEWDESPPGVVDLASTPEPGPAGACEKELVSGVCACGAPARPRTGKRGPIPIRCEACEREYHRAMNRADRAGHHQGPERSLTCTACEATFVSRASRGPTPRRCPGCAARTRTPTIQKDQTNDR